MQLNRPRRIAGAKRTRKKKEDKDKPKGRRGMTPEGAEQEQINPSTMKMADLCRDIRIGVKSSNHDMIKRRIMEKKTRAKLAKTNPELIPVVESTEPAAEQAEEPVSSAPNGPRMRIVDGQIVLAESSLQLDRHKRAEAESEVMLEVEENEFSHMTTSGSYMKRERTQAWDDVDNATFYQGLAQFGTDFETIAKLFPSRSRRQIKLKFNNEERKNPLKINQILMGKPQSIDLVGFEEMSGLKLETVEMIERERAELAAEQEREVQAREREKSEAELKKKKDIADRSAAARKLLNGVDDDLGAELGDGSGKENLNGRKKKGKGRNRNPHGRGDGGEEIQVLGTVE
jgi:transcription factor TFIIIB component B''